MGIAFDVERPQGSRALPAHRAILGLAQQGSERFQSPDLHTKQLEPLRFQRAYPSDQGECAFRIIPVRYG